MLLWMLKKEKELYIQPEDVIVYRLNGFLKGLAFHFEPTTTTTTRISTFLVCSPQTNIQCLSFFLFLNSAVNLRLMVFIPRAN